MPLTKERAADLASIARGFYTKHKHNAPEEIASALKIELNSFENKEERLAFGSAFLTNFLETSKQKTVWGKCLSAITGKKAGLHAGIAAGATSGIGLTAAAATTGGVMGALGTGIIGGGLLPIATSKIVLGGILGACGTAGAAFPIIAVCSLVVGAAVGIATAVASMICRKVKDDPRRAKTTATLVAAANKVDPTLAVELVEAAAKEGVLSTDKAKKAFDEELTQQKVDKKREFSELIQAHEKERQKSGVTGWVRRVFRRPQAQQKGR
jgi:hypothetical protein